MWQLDVAPSPFLPHSDSLSSSVSILSHPELHFLLFSGRRGVDFLVSRDSVCSWTSPSMPLVPCCRQPGSGSPGRFWNAACLLQAMGAKCDGPLERSTWWPMNLDTLRPKAKWLRGL